MAKEKLKSEIEKPEMSGKVATSLISNSVLVTRMQREYHSGLWHVNKYTGRNAILWKICTLWWNVFTTSNAQEPVKVAL